MRELLLINFEGLAYGIWEDEVLSVEELSSIHRLPVSPAYLAGVSIIHDRTVTLADLSVCVGHAPMKKSGAGHVLILSDTEKFAGFAIEGNITKAAIGPDSVHPIPGYLKTLVIDSCGIVNSLPIPVINIPKLYDQMQKPDYEQPSFPIVTAADRHDIIGTEKIRIFEINNERFAASAESMEEHAAPVGRITRLAQARPFVSGVVLHQGRILTIIDLLLLLNMQESGKRDQMLVAELGDTLFGFLVSADKGIPKKEEFTIKLLPPIAQSGWLRTCVKYAGELLPVLDLEEMISSGQKGRHEKPLAERYAPDSRFLDFFGREDLEVLEFSLLGQRHALPKSEVKDIIGFKPYREIPNAPSIVIGVVEQNEELLPVLDLAMVFGRRSLFTSEWRMIQIENGDFRALVITEAVFGERRLPQELQRAVPILLPHHVVYGCYPDADTVRLILNVAALAMHFEKSLVQELLPALSTEMKQAPAELVPSLLEETAVPYSEGVMSELPKERSVPQETVAALRSVEAEEVTPVSEQPTIPEVIEAAPMSAEMENATKPEEISAAAPEVAKPAPEEEELVHKEESETVEPQVTQVISESAPMQEQVSQEAEEQARREAEEKARQEAEERARREAEEQAEWEAEEKARIEAETRMREEIEDLARRAAEEQARREAEAKTIQEAEEQQKAAAARAEEEERVRREAEEKARQEAEERTHRGAEEQAAAEMRRRAESEKKAGEEAAAVLREAGEIARREREEAITGTTAPLAPFKTAGAGTALSKTPPKHSALRKNFISLAIIMIVIGAVLYLLFRKPSNEVKEAKAPVETAQKKTKGPLVLTAPEGSAVETGEYSVKKGDTLWAISKRFTGSPFNYPRVAHDNEITDPDLIYPEQKIIIRKKEK